MELFTRINKMNNKIFRNYLAFQMLFHLVIKDKLQNTTKFQLHCKW